MPSAAALGGLYVVGTVLRVPGAPLSVLLGYLLGIRAGVPVVCLGSITGATVAFYLGRGPLRQAVREEAGRDPRLGRLMEGARGGGRKTILLARLAAGLSFGRLNYLLGASGVGLRDFLVASWGGMLPGTFTLVWAGAALRHLLERAGGVTDRGAASLVLELAGVLVAGQLLAVLSRRSERRLFAPLEDPA